jgi:oligopeptide/dipeptide ABC transporter ATP-binding protein
MSATNETPLLEVKDLRTHFKTEEGIVKAVDGVSFTLRPGQTLGIVGESGSGKSVTSLSLLRLIPSPPGIRAGGEILYRGKDVLKMDDAELRSLRGNKISMIFQDPMTSLNPFLRISTQLTETIRLHQGLNKKDAHARAVEMLQLVGIPDAERRVTHYPHQFSGGMRQRVMIAMALSCNPEVLIADEPTTALDVTIQAQILEVIQDLSKRLGTATILITHDLGVVAGMCDLICVMYAGKVVERGTADELFGDPRHPYTRGLIKSVPRLDQKNAERLYSIPGQPPHVVNLPDACPFHPRCEHAMDQCRKQYPPVRTLGENRQVACWLEEERK